MMRASLKYAAAIAASGTGVATLTVLFLLSVQSPGCTCGDPIGSHLQTLHRAQQAAYRQGGQLLQQTELEAFMGNPLATMSSERYRYRVELSDSGNIVFGYATPKDAYFHPKVGPFTGAPQPAYPSAVSAMTFKPQSETFNGVICTSLTPSGQPLPAPKHSEGTFTCPANTTVKVHP
ncbi:MAG: type IV pilin-like G/H family protein [Cyanobacteria bacterium J06634_5]